MNVIDGGGFYGTIALWVVGAIALVVAFSFFLRTRTRAHYPGGARRYLLALTIQAVGFMAPIPFVLIALLGAPIIPGLDVVLAVAVGIGVVFLLRSLPVTGPMLKDLHRARLEAAMDRLGPKP